MMACQTNIIANFIDLDTVKRRLFPGDHPAGDSGVSSEAWVWPADDLPDDSTPNKSVNKDVNWLQNCQTSLSSTTELLVISHEHTMVILTSKWDSQEEGAVKTKYHITWHGNPCQQPGEYITSVLCLPIISQGKSSHCGPDWTCVVVGFSSGYVRFYTEDCNLLLSEMLHNEPVASLKCQSYQPPQYTTCREPAEEVYVAYYTTVCIVPGFGLFQTLRACRNQLARAQANCGEVIHAPPLAFKKWGFQDQELITDCEVAGPATANTFDHLLTASLCGGFNTWYRSSAPQTSLIVASGKKPFVGFHYALEGGAPPVLTDVAKVMAIKLKSAIGQAVPGWLMGGRKNPSVEKKEIILEPADLMGCRFGLCDHWRHGNSLVMSPNRNLSAVCDSLGRIILVDNQKGVAVRMWKGYRDAQCGWLEVKEDSRQRGSGSRTQQLRTALFLVIYSPKKGIIEIWSMQQGPRIATFTVSKVGRLLYTGYGLMGLNNVQLKAGNRSQCPCVFLEPNGSVKEITVPFHFALSAKNSKRVRDLHLLKQLKTFMREQEFDEERLTEEVAKTTHELKTNEIRCQALEMLASSRQITPDALDVALAEAIDKWLPRDGEPQDPGVKPLKQLAHRLQHLVTLYRFIHLLNQQPPNYTTVVNSNLNPAILASKLETPEREINSLLNLVATIQLLDNEKTTKTTKKTIRSEARVTFGDGGQTTFVEFLSCFESSSAIIIHGGQEVAATVIRKDVGEDELKRISELLCQGALYCDSKIDEWKDAVVASCITPSHLMQLVLRFWLNRRQGAALETEMLRYAQLLKAVCSIAGDDEVCVEYNQLSPWWRDVRDRLISSFNPFMALTAAIVARAVALHIEKNKDHVRTLEEASDETGASDATRSEPMDIGSPDELTASRSSNSEWENVSTDTCQWSVLIGQLEDIALLNAVLSQKPPTEESPLSTSRYCLPFDNMEVSLSYILTRGKGSISELTAHWLTSSSILPKQLVFLTDIEFDNTDSDESKESKVQNVGVTVGKKLDIELGAEATDVDEINAKILGYLLLLKQHFPYSLSSSVLLTNVCWEYMLSWHKSVDELQALECALDCLKTIPSPAMKQGLCSLMWSVHLKQRFEATTLLIQKVGKNPRERLIRQEIGLSETQLPHFLDKCLDFFDIFMESCCLTDATTDHYVTRYEELWPSNMNGPPPLAELTLTQHPVNYDLLHLHYQLALMLHMMLVCNVKFQRPVSNLFDNAGQAAFFAELSSNPQLPSHSPDSKLIGSRTQFLLRVVSATTHGQGQGGIHWMGKCLALGAVWGVSGDVLRRHQICELYSSGLDQLAEEVVPAVVDMPLLASQLMVIVGQRMRHVVVTTPNLQPENISKLSPALSTWLDSMNEETLKNMNCPLSDTAQLLAQVMQYLPEDHADYSLALYMVDAIRSLDDS